MEGEARIDTVISEEWGHQRGRMLRIVIREFCKREEFKPVVLLVVTEDSKILL